MKEPENSYGCEKCAHTGWLSNQQPCHCLKVCLHLRICQKAKIYPAVIEPSRTLKLDAVNGPLPLTAMIERGLGLVLLGDLFKVHAYVAASIWHDLDAYVKFTSTDNKRTIRFLGNERELEETDVIIFPLYPSASFAQKALYEKINSSCKAMLMTLAVPDENSIFRLIGFENKRNMRDSKEMNKAIEIIISSLLQECGIQRPSRVKWIIDLEISAWSGMDG